MGHELGRALLLSDAVSADAMAQALLAAVQRRVSLVRALLEMEALSVPRLEEELARTAPDAPLLRHPVPVLDLVERLPPHLCAALVAVPVRADSLTGTVDVAVADASDPHAAEEIGFYLNAPVRLVRSPLGAIESAIDQVKQARQQSSAPPSTGTISVPPPSPVRPVSRTPPWGMPAYTAPTEQELGSERPLPLVSKPPHERSPESIAERAEARATSGADIPVPLLRRLTPGAGLVALARAAQKLEDEEDPIVELRNLKASTAPPGVVALSPPLPTPPPSIASIVATVVAPRPQPAVPRTLVKAPAAVPLNQLLRDMAKTTARDPLMELVLLAVHPTAHKSALFAVKRDGYVGWMCTPDFGDRNELTRAQIDARKPSLLATIATAGTYVGPVPRNETHAPIAKFIKSQQALGVAIRAAGKPAVVLVAHDVSEPHKAMTTLMDVARVAGETLEKILRAKR